MKKIVLIIIFTVQLSSIIWAQKVTVVVAANAQYAMKEVEKQYEAETGKEIELIIGSSGKLAAQIKEGAPFDIFLSADMEYPQTLSKEGFAVYEPKIYGYGSLVLWTLKEFNLSDINILLLPEIKAIAIANPKLAPYGEAAVAVMNYYKIYEKVQSKLVYGESISQVNQYINSKTADIGFTAKSVVLSPEMKDKGKWIEVDKKAYSPIAQGAILLKSSKDRNGVDAELFYNYLYSSKAKKVFKNYGYQF
ncbi:MAG TPA: molybdate ABC transporter substrate-binding protein [Cytophagaceae bacterium]|nr:molybdate ABC transporter substrate-binding protein [Cytophagaceae bacterium]